MPMDCAESFSKKVKSQNYYIKQHRVSAHSERWKVIQMKYEAIFSDS